MSQLAIQSELDKLGLTLGVDSEALGFLDHVAAEQLRTLRVAIYEVLYREDRVLFGRMAAVAKRLPVALTLQIAERLGPLLTAGVASEKSIRASTFFTRRSSGCGVTGRCTGSRSSAADRVDRRASGS